MIFIGGISQGRKMLEYHGSVVVCGGCGAYGRYQVFTTYMYFSFFFIPLFRWNKQYFVQMSCCGTVYQLDPEKGKAIAGGTDVEIRKEDLTLVQQGRGNPYGNSSQNVWVDPQKAPGSEGNDVKNRGMECPYCGYRFKNDEFEFCPKCGKRL